VAVSHGWHCGMRLCPGWRRRWFRLGIVVCWRTIVAVSHGLAMWTVLVG